MCKRQPTRPGALRRPGGNGPVLSLVLLVVSLAAIWPPVPAAAAPERIPADDETSPVLHTGDAADDPAIWVHPSDPSRSVVIGSDKEGALEVYDLSGGRVQRITDTFFGNVDVRTGFRLAGSLRDVVGVVRRGLRFFTIDPATRRLSNRTDGGSIPTGFTGEGFCLYRSPVSGRFFAFVVARDGRVEQFELRDADADGAIDARRVRAWDVGGEAEGCVADDGLGHFYIAEEDVAIWKYGAEPNDPTSATARVAVDRVGSGGHLVADVEGLTLVYQPDGTGYLFASVQAEASGSGGTFYAVYQRRGG